MTDPNPAAAAPAKAPAPAPKKAADESPESVILVAYPKAVFLYPVLIAALIAGLMMKIVGYQNHDHDGFIFVVSALFLAVLAINFVILAFDFPRGSSLTLFFCIMAILFAALLIFKLEDRWFPAIWHFLDHFHPVANVTFYWSFALILGVIYLCVIAAARFDYWEVRPNELLHRHGFLANVERRAAPNLKIDKEINDVFEYLLLRSGRLILRDSDEEHAIILENVPNIKKKEEAIMRMLGALQVEVRGESSPRS